jgi:hypothetical protein
LASYPLQKTKSYPLPDQLVGNWVSRLIVKVAPYGHLKEYPISILLKPLAPAQLVTAVSLNIGLADLMIQSDTQ